MCCGCCRGCLMLCVYSECTVYMCNQCLSISFSHCHINIFNSKFLFTALSKSQTATSFIFTKKHTEWKSWLFPLRSQPCRRLRRSTSYVSTTKLSRLTYRPMSPNCWPRTRNSRIDCLKFRCVGGGGGGV